MSSQVENGRAFEYAVALALSDGNSSLVEGSTGASTSEASYSALLPNQQLLLSKSACLAASFLRGCDPSLYSVSSVVMQSNSAGRGGDVRDIVVQSIGHTVGVSCKHHHWAVKHSRLSGSLDFGLTWGGHPCHAAYFEFIKPVFADLSMYAMVER